LVYKPYSMELMERRESVKCQLVADAIRSYGGLRLRVTGSSMLPSVFPGDILSIRQSEIAEVCLGDIVLFERDGRLCAHRVLDKIQGTGEIYLVTQGQQLACADPAISARELLGKVTSIERGESRIDPRAGLRLGSRIASVILRHSAIATRLMLHLIASRRSSLSKEAEWII
jgi:signal peptidase I